MGIFRGDSKGYAVIVGVCLFATTTATICKSFNEPKNLETVLNKEEAYYYNGEYNKALEEYQKMANKEKWPVWNVKIAEIHSINGDFEISNTLIESAFMKKSEILKENPQDLNLVEADKDLGKYMVFTYIMNGNITKAIEYGEDFKKKYPLDFEVREILFTAYLFNKNIEGARETLNFKREDLDEYNLSKLAGMNILAGNLDEGLKILKESYIKDKNNIGILDALYLCKEEKELLDLLEKTSGEEKINKLFLSAMYSFNKEKSEEGIKLTKEVESEMETLLIDVLNIYNFNKQGEGFEHIIDNIESKYSKTFSGNYVLAKHSLSRKNIDDAKNYANKSLVLKENYGKTYSEVFSKIILSSDDKKKTSCESYIRRGLYYEPYNIEMLNEYLNYNLEYTQNSEGGFIIGEYIKVLDTENSNVYMKLSKICEENGKIDEAIKILEEGTKKIKDPELYNYIGVLCIRKEQNLEGIEYIRKGYALDNKNPKILNNAAVYYFIHDKNIERARINMQEAYNLVKDTNSEFRDRIIVNNSMIENVYKIYENDKDYKWTVDDVEFIM